MELIKAFIEEVNFVIGRMLQEYNSFGDPNDPDTQKKWEAMSLRLSQFIEDIKVDERIPEINGASNVSALHKAYQTGTCKVYMHEINMHLMSMFTEAEYQQIATILGLAYYQAMRCNAVNAEPQITVEEAYRIFSQNYWLISLYVIRMNYFTPIIGIAQGEKPNET